jgi:hypothetical protein
LSPWLIDEEENNGPSDVYREFFIPDDLDGNLLLFVFPGFKKKGTEG